MLLTQHPLSAAWPSLNGEDFDRLRDDIAANSLREPIVLFESQVLDGWNRYRACRALGIEIRSKLLPEGIDPRAFVISMNDGRRHLTASQRALARAEVWRYEWSSKDDRLPGSPCEEKAVARTAASAAVATVDPTPTSPPSGTEARLPGILSDTIEEQAQSAGVSRATMVRARTVATKGSEEVKRAVRAGTIDIKAGAAIAKLPASEQVQALQEASAPVQQTPKTDTAPQEPAAEEDHGPSLSDLVDTLQRENAQLSDLLQAASADDLKAEAIKWRRAYDNATRQQGEAMDRSRESQEREAVTKRALMRCGKAVGVDDPRKIAAAVEVFVREHTKVAA